MAIFILSEIIVKMSEIQENIIASGCMAGYINLKGEINYFSREW